MTEQTPDTQAPPPAAPVPSPGPPPPGWAPPPLPTSFITGYAPPPPPGMLQPVPPSQPQQVPPKRRSRPWLIAVAAIVVVGLLAAIAVLWVRGMLTPSPTNSPTASPVPTAPVQVETGDVGRTVELRADAGKARVKVVSAEWTPNGELKPEAGTTYLVVALEFTGVSGEVAIGPVMTVAEGADKKEYAVAYGPSMPDLPPGALLHAGDTAKGSVGFMLPPGETTLHFLDADGDTMGSARIPAP